MRASALEPANTTKSVYAVSCCSGGGGGDVVVDNVAVVVAVHRISPLWRNSMPRMCKSRKPSGWFSICSNRVVAVVVVVWIIQVLMRTECERSE